MHGDLKSLIIFDFVNKGLQSKLKNNSDCDLKHTRYKKIFF